MSAATSTVTEFLLARIAEDEAAAKAVAPLGHNFDMGGNRQDERWYVSRLRFSSMDGRASSEQDEAASQHFARHDPARVLAECEAKRRIVEDYTLLDADYQTTRSPQTEARRFQALIAVARAAAGYADHADFNEDWRP